jgi:hypothetical protein
VPLADLLRLAYGAQSAQLLYAAAKLGLADLLQDGRLATAELLAPALRAAVAVVDGPFQADLGGIATELAGELEEAPVAAPALLGGAAGEDPAVGEAGHALDDAIDALRVEAGALGAAHPDRDGALHGEWEEAGV